MGKIRGNLLRSAAIPSLLGGATLAVAQVAAPADFAAQVERGRAAYTRDCGADLTGGQFATALKGPAFLAKWGDAPLANLYDYIHRSMPPAKVGALPDETYAALAALILHENGGTNAAPLASDPAQLALIAPPAAAPRGASGVGGLSQRYPFEGVDAVAVAEHAEHPVGTSGSVIVAPGGSACAHAIPARRRFRR